jgi:hypothetical protein
MGELINASDRFKALGKEVGELVAKKNEAYGDSVRNSGKIMQILYPRGVTAEQIPAALVTVRILDKLSRIANDPAFGGEDPAQDIAGYGLLLMDLVRGGMKGVG